MKTSVLIGLAFSAIGALAIASPAEGVAVAEAPTLVARQTARQCAARRRDFDECKRDEREEAQDLAECRRDEAAKKALFDGCANRPNNSAQLQREYDTCKRQESALERAYDLCDDQEDRIERDLDNCRRRRNQTCVRQKTTELNAKRQQCARARAAERAKDDECDRREDALKASRRSCEQLRRDWQSEVRECQEEARELEQEKRECARKQALLCR